jgi:ribose transport system permease protein
MLIQTIENGLVMLNVNPYLYPMVTSGVIFCAVLLDRLRQSAAKTG